MDRFEGIDAQKGLWLVSSPKLRCQETLSPIAKALNRTVDIHPGLNEQSPGEPLAAFDKRVAAFLDEWSRASASVTILCSHGDWLPVASRRLLGGVRFEHKKAGWLELEWLGGVSSLKWCIPSFKLLYK
jgi:broad specificity phosphatase PhoE